MDVRRLLGLVAAKIGVELLEDAGTDASTTPEAGLWIWDARFDPAAPPGRVWVPFGGRPPGADDGRGGAGSGAEYTTQVPKNGKNQKISNRLGCGEMLAHVVGSVLSWIGQHITSLYFHRLHQRSRLFFGCGHVVVFLVPGCGQAALLCGGHTSAHARAMLGRGGASWRERCRRGPAYDRWDGDVLGSL